MNRSARLFGACLISTLSCSVGLAQPLAPLPQPAHAIVAFDQQSITAAKLSGDAGATARKLGIDDPVRVASISKLVGALVVMRLVDQGKIDLDRDVSGYLGWRVRNPAFPDVPITMRQLLTHRAGIRDNIDYILPLDGALAPLLAKADAWEAKYPPGAYFSYANLNSPLIAATLEGATGERFDRLVARLVLQPLKIDACFNWGDGCSSGRRAQAVTLLRANGDLARDAAIAGPDPCPIAPASDGSCNLNRYVLARHGSAFSPQGGLRISAKGLVRIGQMMLAKGRPILSRKAYAEMTRTHWRFDGKNGDDDKGYFLRYGLGVHIHTDSKGREWMGHVGEAYALRAGFWIDQKARRGKVQFVTMVAEETPVGHCLDDCP
jgi:CubicO group peptidase (beta-lactamase class C family)